MEPNTETVKPRARVITHPEDTDALSAPRPRTRLSVPAEVPQTGAEVSTAGATAEVKTLGIFAPVVTTSDRLAEFGDKKIISRKEVMALFGKSELTIMKWQQNKGLPYIRIPGDKRDTIKFDKEAVVAWGKANGKL
mgnify:CR=1 FL=1